MAINPLVTLIKSRRSLRPAPSVEHSSSEKIQIDRGFQEDGERLEHISVVIGEAAKDLERLEELRTLLESLRGPLRAEFKVRLKENARAAGLSAQLNTTTTRLAETEVELKAMGRRLDESLQKSQQFEDALEQESAVRLAAETEVLKLRPALGQVSARLDDTARDLTKQREENGLLEISNTSLSNQITNLSADKSALKARVDQLNDEYVTVSDQFVAAQRRYEEIRAEAGRFERTIDDLTFALTAERDRVAALEAQLTAVKAEAGRNIAALKAAEDQRRAELANLRDKLDDAQSRSARLEAIREASIGEMQALAAERAELLRLAASRDVEIGQLQKRIQGAEAANEDARRQCADLEMARAAAVLRSDTLAKGLTAMEARIARSDLLVEQKSDEIVALQTSREEIKVKLLHGNEELQGVIAQQKSEISMLRGALDAGKRGKPRASDATSQSA
jgi:chromosome segregation ATPase